MSENNEIANWLENNPYSKAKAMIGSIYGAAIGATLVEITMKENNLREWQHELFRKYGKSVCYALFLILPSDIEAINYLSKYGHELHQISGDNAFVLAFSKKDYAIPVAHFSTVFWESIVKEHVSEGLSIKIANLFNIKYPEFPCLILFEDIRSTRHIKISLKDLKTEEISSRMREVFSVIQTAVAGKENIFEALRKDAKFKNLQKAGQATANTIQGFAQKTFEAALVAWAETTVK